MADDLLESGEGEAASTTRDTPLEIPLGSEPPRRTGRRRRRRALVRGLDRVRRALAANV